MENDSIGDVLSNKVFVVDYMLRAVNKVLIKDKIIRAYGGVYGLNTDVASSRLNDNDEFDDYAKMLRNLIDDRNFYSGNNFADSVYMPVVKYIDLLLNLSDQLKLARKAAFSIAESSNEEVNREIDRIIQSINLQKLEEAYNDLLFKDESSEYSIEVMKKTMELYDNDIGNYTSFDKYYSAYKLSKDSVVSLGRLREPNNTENLIVEFYAREKSIVYGILEEVLPYYLKDISMRCFCDAEKLQVPEIKGSGEEVFIALDKFLNNMKKAIASVQKMTDRSILKTDDGAEFVSSELNFFTTFTQLISIIRTNDRNMDIIRQKGFLNDSKRVIQNNETVLQLIDQIAEMSKTRNVSAESMASDFEKVSESVRQYMAKQPVFDYKYLVEKFKEARELDEPVVEVGETAKTTSNAMGETPKTVQPTPEDIANQKYTEFVTMRDEVMKTNEYDDEDIIQLKLLVESIDNELKTLISGEQTDSTMLAEQVTQIIDNFMKGDCAKVIDKFMYDINYHFNYELKELLSQMESCSFEQRGIMQNISEKASKFGDRYNLLLEASQDGSLDINKVISTYEKLADIKREISKLYNIGFSELDRFSK